MKTDQVQKNKFVTYEMKEKPVVENKEKEVKPSEDTGKIQKQPSKRIELKDAVINNPEAVKKMIGENIEWRDMKFYQREVGGQYYVDIVDRNTGNVVRTIPDTKFAEVTEKFKQLKGLRINING
jgi:uncharacterized FlaG/YvyC family protein